MCSSGAGEAMARRRRDFGSFVDLFHCHARYVTLFLRLVQSIDSHLTLKSCPNFSPCFGLPALSGRRWRKFPTTLLQIQSLPTFLMKLFLTLKPSLASRVDPTAIVYKSGVEKLTWSSSVSCSSTMDLHPPPHRRICCSGRCQTKETLGFSLMDPFFQLGLSSPRPINSSCCPDPLNLWYRFIALSVLPSHSDLVLCFSDLGGRRLHLKLEVTPWIWFWLCFSENLLSSHPLATPCKGTSSLNRRCYDLGYRFYLARSDLYNSLPISTLILPYNSGLAGIESLARRVLGPLGWCDGFLHRFQLNELRSNGIMTTSPWSVGYHCLINQPSAYPMIIEYMACVRLSVGLVEILWSVSSTYGHLSFLYGELFVLVRSWVLLFRPVFDNGISSSISLVPTVSAWSSRGFLGSNISCSLEWFELYPYRGQLYRLVWMSSTLNLTLDSDSIVYLFLKLVLFVSIGHLLSKDVKLGCDIITKDQTDCKLCVEFLNLHGYELNVREDPPALLRFGIHLLRLPVKASSRAMRYALKRLKDVAPFAWNPLLLARITVSVIPIDHSFESSTTSFARAIYDHLVIEDFAKLVFMVESILAPTDFSNIVKPQKLKIPLKNSWSLYL